MGTLLVFSEDGSIKRVSSKKPGEKQLKQLYKLIDTDSVEGMPILESLKKKGMTLFADEEGVSKEKEFNPSVKFLFSPRTFYFLSQYGSPAGVCILELPKSKDLKTVLDLAKDYPHIYSKLKKV